MGTKHAWKLGLIMGHRRWTTYITPPTHQITVQIKRHALSAVRYNNCLDASPFSMFFLTTGYACLAESVFVPRLFSFSFFFFFFIFSPFPDFYGWGWIYRRDEKKRNKDEVPARKEQNRVQVPSSNGKKKKKKVSITSPVVFMNGLTQQSSTTRSGIVIGSGSMIPATID